MPVFEVQGPDGKTYEVDAPDLQSAAGAFAPAQPTDDKAALFAQGKQAAQQRMAAPDEYTEVPVYDFNGAATGATERVMKAKADPLGRGALDVFPFGADIAMLGKGYAPGSDEYAREKARFGGESQAAKEAYPSGYHLGEAGSIAAQMMALRGLPLPGAAWGAEALPESAALGEKLVQAGQRIAGAGAGGATLGGIGGLGEGTGWERLKGAAIGAPVGALVGSGVGAAGEALGALGSLAVDRFGRPLYNYVKGAFAPEDLAMEKAAGTISGDKLRMSPYSFEEGLKAGEPLMIGDVGGTETKGLARAVSNISPEAQAELETPLKQRFESQAERVKADVENYLPDSPDYAKKIEQLQEQARAENGPAYKAAYKQGESGVFNDRLYDLARAPEVEQAMKEANEIAKNQPAYGETKGKIVSPFDWDTNGNLIAREGMAATDANMAYWDMVQRRLRGPLTGLQKTDADAAGRLKDLHTNLLNTLDDVVPAFRNARQGAAEQFGAQDAYEAGVNYAKQTDPKKVSMMNAAMADLTPSEQELFSHGFLFQKLGDISKTGDTRDIAKKAFMGTSPFERDKIARAVDPDVAQALESRLIGEKFMNELNDAVRSGSTTARQQKFSDLTQFGAAGATGAAVGSLDDATKEGTAAGIAAMMLKRSKGKVDVDVANRIARILTSQDPAMLRRLTVMAQRNDQVLPAMRILESQPAGWVGKLLPQTAAPGKPIATTAGQVGMKASDQEPRPLTITRGP